MLYEWTYNGLYNSLLSFIIINAISLNIVVSICNVHSDSSCYWWSSCLPWCPAYCKLCGDWNKIITILVVRGCYKQRCAHDFKCCLDQSLNFPDWFRLGGKDQRRTKGLLRAGSGTAVAEPDSQLGDSGGRSPNADFKWWILKHISTIIVV